MTDLFVSAGEPSGDLLGAQWLQELLKERPDLNIGAVAGPRMRALPIQTHFRMENLQVMGFLDVLLALPKIARQFFTIRNHILKLNPKAVVCIDYPGFHLRLERSLRKKGYSGKLIHFVCPTVWAWGKKRIALMEKNLDLLLVLLPFEPKCFNPAKLLVKYVGHPLSSIPSPTAERKKILALYPGSRKKEIERNFPLQLKIAQKLLTLDPELQIAVSIAHPDLKAPIEALVQNLPVRFSSSNYELMQTAHLALATSGTATLELALHETPTIVNYAIRPLDCWIARRIFQINLPYYALPNIIASQRIFPELFGPHLTETQFLFWAQKLWFDSAARAECLAACRSLRHILGTHNSARETALQILKMI